MSDEVHSESEFYYLDELEFKKNSDLTETNYKQREKTKETVKERLKLS